MKKAYIIVAHKNPKQLYRLISRLNDGNSEFFVHIDLNSSISSFYEILDIGEQVHFLPRFNSAWGAYGTIEPYLCGMRVIKDSGKAFDRIMLLSGQDYPIRVTRKLISFSESLRKAFSLIIIRFQTMQSGQDLIVEDCIGLTNITWE